MTRKPHALVLMAAVCLLLGTVGPGVHAHEDHDHGAPADKPNLETLLKTALERVEGTEVIVSRVTLPPHTTLPRHWHPGEEFAYVIEGEATLWQDGKDDVVIGAGEAIGIPLKQVHTAITGEVGATLLVFRVHEAGQPERVLVD